MKKLALLSSILALLLIPSLALAQGLLPNGEQQFIDQNGSPYAGGSVYFYVPSTTTPKTTYSNSTLTTPNSNPVILDAAGRAVIWGAGQYRQQLFDALGNLIWDKVTSDGPGGAIGSIFWGGTSTGSANTQAISVGSSVTSYTAGLTINFIPGFTNTAGTTLNVNSLGAQNILTRSSSGLIALTSGAIQAGQQVQVVYDGAEFVLQQNIGVRRVKNLYYAVSGTYTPSTGMLYVTFTCVAGGGGGGGFLAFGGYAGGGGGGGAGGWAQVTLSAAQVTSDGGTETMTIGAGGTAGTPSDSIGGTGGTTSVGSHCAALGGGGGTLQNFSTLLGNAGVGGSGSVGDFGAIGANGGFGFVSAIFNFSTAFLGAGGTGGNTNWGQGGSPGGSTGGCNNGQNGTVYGAGGGGGGGTGGSINCSGGAGASGFITATEYLNQ